MAISFQPKIEEYFSKNGRKDINHKIKKMRMETELSRDVLAKNIILPTIAKFQFAEFVEIDKNGNVSYNEIVLDSLFYSGWESFRPALPSPKVLPRELKTCKIGEEEYENFLKQRFDGLCKDGLIEKRVTRENIDLARVGEVYQPKPGVWKEVETGKTVESKIKEAERKLYRLKEGSDWYELLRKVFSHENPVGISFGDFNIGYDPYRTFYENLRTSYQDFNSKLERVDEIEERKAEKRKRVDPDLTRRLMRLYSNLMELYSISTKSVIKNRSKFVTLRPPYILERVVDSFPALLGSLYYDASEISKRYTIPG